MGETYQARRNEPKGELTPGTVGSLRLTYGVKSDFKMTEINPSRNWKWVGPFLWLVVHYDHRFERMDEQHTKLTWLVSADGFGVSILGRLFAAIYNTNLDKAIPCLISEMNALNDQIHYWTNSDHSHTTQIPL